MKTDLTHITKATRLLCATSVMCSLRRSVLLNAQTLIVVALMDGVLRLMDSMASEPCQ